MFTGRKLALTIAFTVLVALAFGVGCRNFFQPNTLTAVSIQPPTPQVEVGPTSTVQVQAWGTYSDNSRAQITSGVSWTSAPNTIVQIDGTCATQECGAATLEGVASGTSTLTAAAQGLSATATVTAYLGNITSFEACEGESVPVTSCTTTWNPNVTNGDIPQDFVAQGNSGGQTFDLTTSATWTVSPTPAAGSIQCDNSGVSPETCTAQQGTTAGPYTITVTYGSGSSTETAKITITVTG
jgi:hypothetical protein